jgi:hypothetical protein
VRARKPSWMSSRRSVRMRRRGGCGARRRCARRPSAVGRGRCRARSCGDHWFDASLPDEAAVLVVVVAAVGEQRPWSSSWSADTSADRCRRRLRGGGACCPAGRDRLGWDPFSRPSFSPAGDSHRRSRAPTPTGRRVQFGEEHRVQLVPDPGLLPGPQPTPGGHPTAEAELLRQMLLPDSRVQHEQDPLQREAIVERPATGIAEPPLLLWQQRLDPLPQPVRHLPRLRPHRHPPNVDDRCRRTSLTADGSLHSARGSWAGQRPRALSKRPPRHHAPFLRRNDDH